MFMYCMCVYVSFCAQLYVFLIVYDKCMTRIGLEVVMVSEWLKQSLVGHHNRDRGWWAADGIGPRQQPRTLSGATSPN